jgi:hypothetical protein
MGNYGIKIAKSGQDISASDRYMILTSKYPVLKLQSSGQGTLSYVAGNTGKIVEITHNLGYVPICFVYGEYFDIDTTAVIHRYNRWNRWIYQGVQVADLYQYYADTTKLYITFGAASGITDAYSFDLAYMYHIFYDEDTL